MTVQDAKSRLFSAVVTEQKRRLLASFSNQ